MISLTERARQKLQEVADNLPEEHSPIWDVVFMGFGWGGPRMGLVQSNSDEAQEDVIEVEGFPFSIEQSLKRLVPVYGDLVVDFRKNFFGEGFMVSFNGQSSC